MPAPEPDDDAIEAETFDAELVEVETNVVSLFKDAPALEAGPVDDVDEFGPGEYAEQTRSALALRLETVAARPITPGLVNLKASARWWVRSLWRGFLWALTHPHVVLGGELRPIGRGIAVTWRAWRAWMTEKDYAATVITTPAGTPGHEKAATDLAKMRSGHRKLSTFITLILLAAGTTLWFLEPLWLALAGVLLFALFDFVGRRNPVEGPARVVRRTLLEEGAPLGALAAQVINRLNEDKVRADPGGPMRVHDGGEYRMNIVHEDAITAKHLRSLERHLAARPGSLRLVGTADAGTSELRLPTRDVLKGKQVSEWIPTGSLSATDYLTLGRSEGEQPLALKLTGTHTGIVGKTRSGKTEGALWSIIDRLSACWDAVIWGVDLQNGPAFPMWRGVIQRKAFTPEDAAALLDAVLDEIDDRMTVLNRLAESDDDDEAGSTWASELGAWLFIIIDEFALTADCDGEKGKVDLVSRIEKIARIGLKVGVQLVLASQKTGNSDFGSQVVSTQMTTKILLACTERDTTTMLSTEHRDRGWTPHMLQPAQGDDPRDAGIAFIEAPSHTTPDRYRFDAWSPGEVKRRARRRMADGLPHLDGTPAGERQALLLSPVQVAVEEIFAARGEEWLPTAEISAELAQRGFEVKPAQLADELCNAGSKRDWNGRRQLRGYAIADVRRAWGYDE